MSATFPVIAKSLFYAALITLTAAFALAQSATPVTNINSHSVTQPMHREGLPTNFPTERVIIDAKQSPWNRIGNLSIAGRKFCSASLISDRVIVTAAHCLWNQNTEDWYPAQFIHFLAGYQQEEYVAHSRAKNIFPNPNYQFRVSVDPQQLSEDWALIELEEPLGLLLGYFSLQLLSPSQQRQLQQSESHVALAGYRRDTREALSLDTQCQLSPTPKHFPRNLLGNNCHGLSGDSGGPLLIQQAGYWHLLGIHAGRSIDSRQNTLALAIPTSAFYDQLLSILSQTSLKR
ncbi:MAG: trypsin-like serine peptidase [Cellvibrionaceae bacterium]